ARLCALPRAARSRRAAGARAVGGPAADGGRRPGTDERAPPAHARRAVAGHRAAARVGGLRLAARDQPGGCRRVPGRAERARLAQPGPSRLRPGGRARRERGGRRRTAGRPARPPRLPWTARRARVRILAQQLVLGLMLGGLYGLAAAGLSLVFGVLKVLNVAHGELIMLGGYAAFFAVALLGLDPFAS